MIEIKRFITCIKSCADRYRSQISTAHPELQDLLRGVDDLHNAMISHEENKPKRGRPKGSGTGLYRGRYN